ncbi:response regulator [Kaistia sp. 32K]|uniref:response regulator n=1 Tax=Kaistia sp. 32K TaxID=2795690 RepID=UPI0019153512|nr:response regulator [Kaistia sp. 32K]BCP53812.1 response regulator [Kaistia sp. 32K]
MELRSPAPSILVIEDESLIAMELCMVLEDGGYTIMGPVASVAAALAMLNKDLPDACVLDLNLRGEHSVPVAVALKQRNVPFLLATAYKPGTLDLHPAFAGVGHVGKPILPEALLSMIASLLKRRA